MGIRQTLNRNPVLSGAIAATIIAVVAATQIKRACSAPPQDVPEGAPRAFFTIDDGNNWFPDDARKVPPFKHQGKDAYRVAVFRCPGGKPFAARLERFSEAARERLQDAVDHAGSTDDPLPAGGASPHPEMEVKRPGQKEWVRQTPKTAKEFAAIMEARCPDGSTTGIEPVYPD